MAAPITELRGFVKAAVEAEFAAEGFPVYDDRMHEAAAFDHARAAVYPMRETPGEATITESLFVVVQVFDRVDLQIDPTQLVDPSRVEGWAWRLQRRMKTASHTNTEHVYWLNVRGIEYPPDPTDNITRFEMLIEGFAPNSQYMETTA